MMKIQEENEQNKNKVESLDDYCYGKEAIKTCLVCEIRFEDKLKFDEHVETKEHLHLVNLGKLVVEVENMKAFDQHFAIEKTDLDYLEDELVKYNDVGSNLEVLEKFVRDEWNKVYLKNVQTFFKVEVPLDPSSL